METGEDSLVSKVLSLRDGIYDGQQLHALFCLPRYRLFSQELMRLPLQEEGQIGFAKTDPILPWVNDTSCCHLDEATTALLLS